MKRDIPRLELEKMQNARNKLFYEEMELYERENRLENELRNTISIAHNTREILDKYEKEFETVTKLKPKDIKFVFLATGLQCIRQYCLTFFIERLDDKSAAKKVKGKMEEHSNRQHQYYRPSLEEIISNPVPFDVTYGSKEKGLGIGGGFQHRAKTLGHDSVLGWVFGTMNILTSTVTTNEFKTYHVKTGTVRNRGTRDQISDNADTGKMISYSLNRFTSGKKEDIKAIGVSLYKEAIHLKSDIGSIAGLPLPIVSTVSVKTAENLATYGLDMGNVLSVGKQALYAQIINSLIAMLHRLICWDADMSEELFEVRTRKILSYSSVIASCSNLIVTGIGVAAKNEKLTRTLDVGGLLVTLHRLVSDHIFISELKREFIIGNYMEMI